MYNPFQLSECEKEKKKYRRKSIDMSMTILGIVASLSSVPQVIKIAGNGNIEGVSLATQVIAPFSLVAWFSYGLYIKKLSACNNFHDHNSNFERRCNTDINTWVD